MQVVCGNCQLSFQAPEGAAGLMCPICRSPLRPASGDGAANQNVIEWQGGALDDLVAFFSGPALAVRVEVLPAKGDTPVGEVHMLAGGVSEASTRVSRPTTRSTSCAPSAAPASGSSRACPTPPTAISQARGPTPGRSTPARWPT